MEIREYLESGSNTDRGAIPRAIPTKTIVADQTKRNPFLYSWPVSKNLKVKGHVNGNSLIPRERLQIEAPFQALYPLSRWSPIKRKQPNLCGPDPEPKSKGQRSRKWKFVNISWTDTDRSAIPSAIPSKSTVADQAKTNTFLWSWPLSQNLKVKGNENGNSWISRERIQIEAPFQCYTH
jgi:hypothetical protein